MRLVSSVNISTYSIEVVNDPHFTVVILQVILDVVLFHVHTHVFLHALSVVFLELERVLQRNIAACVRSLLFVQFENACLEIALPRRLALIFVS